jgi:hypothetical protein
VISWPTCGRRINAPKAQSGEIEFIDEYIDHSNWVRLGNIILPEAEVTIALGFGPLPARNVSSDASNSCDIRTTYVATSGAQ